MYARGPDDFYTIGRHPGEGRDPALPRDIAISPCPGLTGASFRAADEKDARVKPGRGGVEGESWAPAFAGVTPIGDVACQESFFITAMKNPSVSCRAGVSSSVSCEPSAEAGASPPIMRSQCSL